MITKSLEQKPKVLGNAIISVLKSMDSHYLAKKYLTKHNFDFEKINGEDYYELDSYLDLLNDIHNDMPLFLTDIGRQVFSQAKFPPEIDSLEKAYNSIGIAYQMNHENEEASSIVCSKISENNFHIKFISPYPSKFNIGIIQGISLALNTKVIIGLVDESDENNFNVKVLSK